MSGGRGRREKGGRGQEGEEGERKGGRGQEGEEGERTEGGSGLERKKLFINLPNICSTYQ